ncbi:hypothetical protein H8356DRAFT_1366384 [Neocallimastix lanati (nom. inval.)]|nr:hypothetical protein H8356DRAFT_1366384 [Neocallimastix sp. JGI-2020a]
MVRLTFSKTTKKLSSYHNKRTDQLYDIEIVNRISMRKHIINQLGKFHNKNIKRENSSIIFLIVRKSFPLLLILFLAKSSDSSFKAYGNYSCIIKTPKNTEATRLLKLNFENLTKNAIIVVWWIVIFPLDMLFTIANVPSNDSSLTLNKCKSLIILNDKKEVLKYESLHNHLEKEIDVSISVAKHKIKEEIRKNSIPMDIKPKHIFNAVSQEMGISNASKKVFPNINIKYCVWHYKKSLENQKNILCYHEHLTNNASESYNSYLNNIFPNKPLFFKLIYILKEEENLSYNDYQRRTKGTFKKKQKIFSASNEIKILIENYKSKEINLFYNGCNRNESVKL